MVCVKQDDCEQGIEGRRSILGMEEVRGGGGLPSGQYQPRTARGLSTMCHKVIWPASSVIDHNNSISTDSCSPAADRGQSLQGLIGTPGSPVTAPVANTRRSTNAGLTLGQRLRRWPNVKPTLFERLVFAGRASAPSGPAPARSISQQSEAL